MVETLPVGRYPLQQQRLELKRFFSSHKTILAVLWIVAFGSVFLWQRNIVGGAGFSIFAKAGPGRPIPKMRPFAFNLTDFGGVGDGVADETTAFEKAVLAISKFGKRGGAQLNVPPGKWVTAPFNLTSHMTLFLAEDAEILGVQDEKRWPLMPSYGHGREHKGARFGSLIHGQNLRDVITDSYAYSFHKCYCFKHYLLAPFSSIVTEKFVQLLAAHGQSWWKKYRQKLLNNNTRGPLVQIMWSSDIVISNITLRDSPFWTFHPYDCKNITVRNVTILAPIFEAPNTDGIDPGVQFESRLRLEEVGITYRNLTFDGARVGNEHPDDDFDRKAIPIIRDISFTEIYGQGVRVPVRIQGSEDIPIRNVTFRDMSIGVTYKKKHIFQCAFVEGRVIGTIFPAPCENLDRYDEEERLVLHSEAQNVTDIDYDMRKWWFTISQPFFLGSKLKGMKKKNCKSVSDNFARTMVEQSKHVYFFPCRFLLHLYNLFDPLNCVQRISTCLYTFSSAY
ncbi:hypothetical protein V6N13_002443 [Hibiscus sabdariffa]|uniref:Polygalacturonase n=1 Tax=Hibiscus sabdariffa TaxID=183260 RepID=A0ABR2C2V7_9ROSI